MDWGVQCEHGQYQQLEVIGAARKIRKDVLCTVVYRHTGDLIA